MHLEPISFLDYVLEHPQAKELLTSIKTKNIIQEKSEFILVVDADKVLSEIFKIQHELCMITNLYGKGFINSVAGIQARTPKAKTEINLK